MTSPLGSPASRPSASSQKSFQPENIYKFSKLPIHKQQINRKIEQTVKHQSDIQFKQLLVQS
jgi:hypothetical protein